MIEVKLVSEAIFDSGEMDGNLVQTKVLADPYGFVYFHGKSLKGQLKRQAFWILEQYKEMGQEERARDFYYSMIKLFGMNKEEHDQYGIDSVNYTKVEPQGVMKLSHLQLDERIREQFRALQKITSNHMDDFILSPYELIEAQTNIRTGIQLENGVVKQGRTTTYHTVKDGLIFYAYVSLPECLSEEIIEDLRRIVHSYRRIGAGIHRGRGEVQSRLISLEKEDRDVSRN